jgi:hypothetical protein
VTTAAPTAAPCHLSAAAAAATAAAIRHIGAYIVQRNHLDVWLDWPVYTNDEYKMADHVTYPDFLPQMLLQQQSHACGAASTAARMGDIARCE